MLRTRLSPPLTITDYVGWCSSYDDVLRSSRPGSSKHFKTSAERELKESQIKVEYLGSDPDALKKISEQRALSERKQNNE